MPATNHPKAVGGVCYATITNCTDIMLVAPQLASMQMLHN